MPRLKVTGIANKGYGVIADQIINADEFIC